MKLTLQDRHFYNVLEFNLQHKISDQLKILHFTPVYGGDINQSFKLETNKGNFFIKLNDANIYPEMFEKEAKGLQTLRNTDAIYVPEVILTGQVEDTAFLILECIENDGLKNKDFWQSFGYQLAELHRNTNDYFGFEEDNYIGSLIQNNSPDTSWANFYIENRLKYQLKIALNKGFFNPADVENFEKLFEIFPHIIPDELPNLLHGDLWSGNFLASREHGPVLIDPAVYYGSREVDLAMTQLFGGFEDEFYAAYHEAYPLHNGWQQRLKIYQLYPLLVHVNLFGGSYINSVRRTLSHILNNFE
jgi:fructosamine-3-kinase